GGDGTGPIGPISGGASVDYAGKRVFFASRARVGGSANTLWCLNLTAAGLTFAWAAPYGDIDGSPVLRGGKLYVGNNAGDVIAVDPGDGTEVWRYATGDGPVKGFVFPDRSNLYFSTTSKVWGLADQGATVSLLWPAAVDTIPGPSVALFT